MFTEPNKMKRTKITAFFILTIMTVIASFNFHSCKKIDLERKADVKTESAENIFTTSVKATGDIIDLGEEETIKENGFCLSYSRLPIIEDKAIPPFENTNIVGKYSSNISGLTANKPYQMRSYLIDNAGKVVYGNTVEFHTPNNGGNSVWLKYDDGYNVDGIGLIDGGEFDVAIRFPVQYLQNYDGYKVVKIKFFPKDGTPVNYYVTLWEGTSPPTLIYYEEVSSPNIGNWTEFYPSQIYTINANKELWVGYWVVDQPAGSYPAGIDNGPATTGKGDMFSVDNGSSWVSMSEEYPASFDFNWNIQVYISNEKGKMIQLTNDRPAIRETSKSILEEKPLDQIVSKKENNIR